MVSTIILSPQQNQNIVGANQDFEVVIAITHLTTGQFTNPQNTYYSAPQQLDDEGFILGHSHITIQVPPVSPNINIMRLLDLLTNDRILLVNLTLLRRLIQLRLLSSRALITPQMEGRCL
jgi:hypothetical protein